MPVTRTYACDTPACEGFRFTKFHSSSDDPYPKCPQCGDDPHWVPVSFATTTVKSKALDIAADMMADYGLTDMNDQTRPGDIAAKGPPPVQTAERDKVMQSLSEMQQQTAAEAAQAQQRGVSWSWQGGMGSGMPIGPSTGATAAREQGVDPIALLHDQGKQGNVRMTAEVVGAADTNGEINPKRQGTSVAL